MAGQQPARDGQDCLPAPGMGGLGRKIEAFFLSFPSLNSTITRNITENRIIIPLFDIKRKVGNLGY